MADTLLTPEQIVSYNSNIDAGADLLDDSAALSTTSGLASIAKAGIDYSLLNTKAAFQKTQAEFVELQTSEQVNLLMDRFNQAIGAASFGAARRNVKLGEGSVALDIEQSSMNVGEDIQLAKRNAKSKADALRAQSKINKQAGIISLGSNLTGGVSSLMQARKLTDKAKETRSGKLI